MEQANTHRQWRIPSVQLIEPAQNLRGRHIVRLAPRRRKAFYIAGIVHGNTKKFGLRHLHGARRVHSLPLRKTKSHKISRAYVTMGKEVQGRIFAPRAPAKRNFVVWHSSRRLLRRHQEALRRKLGGARLSRICDWRSERRRARAANARATSPDT